MRMMSSWDFSTKRTQIVSWRTYGSGWRCLDWNCTQIRRAGSSSVDLLNRTGNAEEKATRHVRFPRLHAHQREEQVRAVRSEAQDDPQTHAGEAAGD